MTLHDKIANSKSDITFSESLNNVSELMRSYDDFVNGKIWDNHQMQFILVRIVSAFESFFKDTIGGLIDQHEKFLSNAQALIKKSGLKFDFEDIAHLSKSKFTVGDLISYSLKYSSISTILKNFNEVSGIDFLKEVDKAVVALLKEEIHPAILKERGFDKGRMLNNINYIYEVRNIICHDFYFTRNRLTLSVDKIKECLLDGCLFIELGYEISSTSLFMPIGKIIEKEIKLRLQEKRIEINRLIDKIQNDFNSQQQLKNLEMSIVAFENYLNTNASTLGGNFYDNASIDSYSNRYSEIIIDSRIALLKEYLLGQ